MLSLGVEQAFACLLMKFYESGTNQLIEIGVFAKALFRLTFFKPELNDILS
tara:strand:+ start:9447 stop:9599 length:153 start_codon:yes stop_codon:yes gene_type:complete